MEKESAPSSFSVEETKPNNKIELDLQWLLHARNASFASEAFQYAAVYAINIQFVEASYDNILELLKSSPTSNADQIVEEIENSVETRYRINKASLNGGHNHQSDVQTRVKHGEETIADIAELTERTSSVVSSM